VRRACISLLACPVCGGGLAATGASARCERGHSYDFARAGYLNLSPTRARRRVGDSAQMVAAREQFLARGHFEPLAQALTTAVETAYAGAGDRAIVEIGSGTGYYLKEVAAVLEGEGACRIGIDLSVAAARVLARRQDDALSVVADVEAGIPLKDGAATLALSAFAPRPAAALARVLAPGGLLVVLAAAEEHLAGLRERAGLLGVHPEKLQRLTERLEPAFAQESCDCVDYELELCQEDAVLLLAMGPSARHAPDRGGGALGGPVRVSASVVVLRRR
jgi:23S rRNA (guanine745-N1)-methyltransferase